MISESPKILVVDNHVEYATTIRRALINKGWSADIAFSPQEATVKVAEMTYDICIVGNRLIDSSDVNDRSGIRLIKDLSQNDEKVRFIFNTGYPTVEDVTELLRPKPKEELRVLSVLHKTEGIDKIIETIETSYIPRSAELQELIPEEAPPSVVMEEFRSLNTDLIHELKEQPSVLYQIRPEVFEELIAELLASYGWKVDLTKKTRDGGYDIFAVRKDISGLTSSWIIECKRYRRDRNVGIDVARALYGMKTDLRIGMALIATTSYFSRDVYSFKSSRYDLDLKDFEGVVEWINEYRPNPYGKLYVKENRLIIQEGSG